MSPSDLEQTLRNLSKIGTLQKDRGYRQVWRFEHENKAYYLKFYPRRGTRGKRLIRGSPAMREFLRLQWLQKASIPSPRAVAVLMGFRIDTAIGDAVILDAIEPSVQLDHYLNDLELAGEPIPGHLQLSQQVRSLVYQLGRAKLGHSDLHLGNFLLHQNRLYLLDGYAVRKDGLRQNDILLLGHSAARYATLTDLQRAWEQLGPGGRMPRRNGVSRVKRRTFLGKITKNNRYFGRLRIDRWSGFFFKHAKYARRWSTVSRLDVTEKDWQRAWPLLLGQIESDQLSIIKRTRSGDVLTGEVVLGGRPIPVVVKRPKKKYLLRYLSEIGRGVRARRAWHKAWNLLIRNTPTAWPLIVMEKRALGYVTDAIIVFEKVPGPMLSSIDLDALSPSARQMLFRRTGRLLRMLERDGLYHGDAKSSNWIVLEDDKRGPTPILIDVDGIRRRTAVGIGIERLLRSMREHPQYTPEDSLELCKGYAPFAPVLREQQQSVDAA